MNKEEQASYNKLVNTITMLQEHIVTQQQWIEELEEQIAQYKFEQEINGRF